MKYFRVLAATTTPPCRVHGLSGLQMGRFLYYRALQCPLVTIGSQRVTVHPSDPRSARRRRLLRKLMEEQMKAMTLLVGMVLFAPGTVFQAFNCRQAWMPSDAPAFCAWQPEAISS